MWAKVRVKTARRHQVNRHTQGLLQLSRQAGVGDKAHRSADLDQYIDITAIGMLMPSHGTEH